MTIDRFKQDILSGIPETLPKAKPYDPTDFQIQNKKIIFARCFIMNNNKGRLRERPKTNAEMRKIDPSWEFKAIRW